MSPLVQQYQQWASGRAWEALPRPVKDFLEGAFGPLAPIVPVGIDQPREDTGRPAPRRWQYPVGYNLPVGQPGSEWGLKLAPFSYLRQFAEVSSVLRACIEIRKNEVLGMTWDIVPTDESLKQQMGRKKSTTMSIKNPNAPSQVAQSQAQKQQADFESRKSELLDFFKRPDPNFKTFTAWLAALLEDVFVTDTLSLYIYPSLDRKAGPLGSGIAEMWALDGTTIRPLLDTSGGTPRPPAPAYQQYLWGIPRAENIDIMMNRDLDRMKVEYGLDDVEALQTYKSDQLLYVPYLTRSWTPYGFSNTERCILPNTTMVKRQQWQFEFFTEGSIPGVFITPGVDLPKHQQRELQETLNAIAGDTGYKHKIIVLPMNSKTDPMKPTDLSGAVDETLYQQIAMAFQIQPSELGLMMGRGGGGAAGMSGGAGGSGAMSQQSGLSAERKQIMAKWLKDVVFDYLLQDVFGQDDMEWHWPDLDATQDEVQKSTYWKNMSSFGAMSVDEVRNDAGLEPWGVPQASDPMVFLPTGPVPLGNVPPTIESAEWDKVPMVVQPDGSVAPDAAAPGVQDQLQAQMENQSAQTQRSTNDAIDQQQMHVAAGTVAPPKAVSKPAAGSPPGANRPAQKALTGAMYAELEQLRRYLKKGRPINKWQSNVLPQEVLESIADDLSST